MKKAVLVIIILIGLIFRFYKLGEVPPSLYWDEVALGYNAYSIAETLRDEEGIFLPYQYVRSFGDFKPPVYIYLAAPIIKIAGLNEWTTRFPSAFLGSLSILLTYLVTRKLFNRIKESDRENNEWIAISTAFLLAISPWHTQLSRVAYEANVALFFVLFGVLTFLTGLESKNKKILWYCLSSVSFVLTLYTFNSNRVFTPLFVIFTLIVFWKEIFNKHNLNLKPVIISAAIGLALLLPLVPHLTSKEGQLRYKEVNIFSDSKPVELANQRAERLGNTWWAKIINNRRILFTEKWLDGYLMHFSGRFLFITGDFNPRFSIQDVGELYIVEIPFLLIGLYLLTTKFHKEHVFILGWMLLGPVPAAFARETPHALRSLNMLPTFQIITAIGFVGSLIYLRKIHFYNTKILPSLLGLLTAICLAANIFYFLHIYYVHYPKFAEREWQYGYKQMIQELKKIQGNYDKIVITDALGRPYINTLFYLNYPPELFHKQREAKLDDTGFGFVEVYKFGKYEFRGINWKLEIANTTQGKTLVIGNTNEISEGKYTKAVIRRMDGSIVFLANEVPEGYDRLVELGFEE
jgi:4-amino-4-deoxy-L-arabinose transferase-like glycosyltransferase